MSMVEKILEYRNYILKNTDEYMLFEHKITKDKIIVFMCEENLNIQLLKLYLKILSDIGYNHAIIIYSLKITPSSNKILDTVKNIYEIELFTKDEMSIDFKQYKYYFPHIKVNNELKKELITKYGNRLPIILKKDIIIRYFNFKKGDIIKIIRDNNYITYKIVK
jgi:DNA-directed RNA polymerase subunit H (RpoH/RPB5)